MSETNFEKNVQQEMLGFKIKPSEEVWTKVEERIRKKKRKRFFFLLFFAGLALLGYWQRDLLFNEKEPAPAKSVSLPQQKNSSAENLKTTIPDNISKESRAIENFEKEKISLIKNKRTIDPVKEKINTVKKENQINQSSAVVTAGINHDSEKSTAGQVKSTVLQPVETLFPKDTVFEKTSTENLKNDSAEVSIIKSDTLTITDSGKMDENKIQLENIQKPEAKADSLSEIKKQVATPKKWKWGVEVTPGISSFADQLLSVSSQKSADFLNAPPTGGVSNPPASPSKREPGFALQLRGFVQRKIAKKTQLSLGLQYSFYSDRILIGGRRDSILNYAPQSMTLNDASRVYGIANSFSNYTNRYHFIELPVELHFQLNKNSKNPFYFNLGLTAGQLISTNALMYDTAFGGIYFDGKKQLNKTQFSLSTGFLWTFSSKKAEWSVGPVVNVYLNRFLDNPFEKNQYLFMPGLRTKIILPRKN